MNTAAKDHAAPMCITPSYLKVARAWIEQRNGQEDLYFSVNPTKKRMSYKPAESDIAEFAFAHVDCDPLPGEAALAARNRTQSSLRRLRKLVCGAIHPLPRQSRIYPTSANSIFAELG